MSSELVDTPRDRGSGRARPGTQPALKLRVVLRSAATGEKAAAHQRAAEAARGLSAGRAGAELAAGGAAQPVRLPAAVLAGTQSPGPGISGPTRPPSTRAGALGAAFEAVVVVGQVPFGELVPVAADQEFAAFVAVSALAGLVEGVAGVGVADAGVDGDAARARDRVSGGVWGWSIILKSGWKAVKCSGTSVPMLSCTQSTMLVISSSLSFSPGISRVVSSNQMSVSCFRYLMVSSTGSRDEPVSFL